MSFIPKQAGYVYEAFRNSGGNPAMVDWGEEDAIAITWIVMATAGSDLALGTRLLSAMAPPGRAA